MIGEVSTAAAGIQITPETATGLPVADVDVYRIVRTDEPSGPGFDADHQMSEPGFSGTDAGGW